MNNILLGARAGLDCNMESLISDLRHQYTAAAAAAAAATTVVSQAMLIQAINNHQTRLEALTPPDGQIVPSRQQPVNQVRRQTQPPPASNQTEQPAINALGQFVPLDLSVRTRQAATSHQNSRQSRAPKCLSQRRQLVPYDLVKTKVRVVGQEKQTITSENPDLNNNNSNNHLLQRAHTKLISSSTSPSSVSSGEDENDRTISASSSRIISSSSPNRSDRNDRQHEFSSAVSSRELTKGLKMAATDVISSTNGRRQRRPTSGKKQKTSRSHLCNYCGRSFARSDMLTRHSRVHSGLKPFQCGECFQEFSRSDHLSTHQRTHTGEKPYQCDSCGYSACRRDMITRHMRTHLGQRVKRSRESRSRKASQSATSTSSTTSTIGNRVRATRKRQTNSSRCYEGTDGKVDNHDERDNVFISHG